MDDFEEELEDLKEKQKEYRRKIYLAMKEKKKEITVQERKQKKEDKAKEREELLRKKAASLWDAMHYASGLKSKNPSSTMKNPFLPSDKT